MDQIMKFGKTYSKLIISVASGVVCALAVAATMTIMEGNEYVNVVNSVDGYGYDTEDTPQLLPED